MRSSPASRPSTPSSRSRTPTPSRRSASSAGGSSSRRASIRPGDKLVYCEIDSLLPERPEFEFLRASSFKPAQTDAAGAVILPAGFRIKTVKLRGQVSQGICFPLSILPPGAPTEEGADVTDLLGVLKWEPPLPVGMGGQGEGRRSPASCRRPTRPACRCWRPCLQRHRGKTFYVTEKLDGTSFTAFLRAGRVRHLQPQPVDGRGRRVERPGPGRQAAEAGGEAAGRPRAARASTWRSRPR